MTQFISFTDAQWADVQAARADWPADIDWPKVRGRLEQAGRDFLAMRANRLRQPPKLGRRRLQSALERVRPLGHKHIEHMLENQLAIYEAWSSRHFGARADAHRELLYWRVLAVWTNQMGGELKFSHADEVAVGPLIRFLATVFTAILGNEAPKPAGLAGIIVKERRLKERRRRERPTR